MTASPAGRPGVLAILLAVQLALLALAACTPSDGGRPAARFVVLEGGVVRDTRTGLEWTPDDGGRNLDWPAAERRCADLALGGRGDWRLPTIDELFALYDEQASQPCGERTCRADPAITLTYPYFWSATGRESSRRFYLDFQFGTRLAPVIRPTLVRRVLCVRG